MSDILGFLQSTPGIILLTAIALTILTIWFIRQDSFQFTDLTYRMPFIGKLTRYSRDYSETQHGKWLNSEARLCHDYARHLNCMPREEFDNHIEYLRKCYDNGRKPMPWWAWLIFGVLLMLEAFGFSFMLSQWMAMEATEDLALAITAGIVLVLSGILLWITHTAGHQIYRTRLLRSCFQQFQAHGLHDQENRQKSRQFTTQIVSLSQDQSVDNEEPAHVQCANRVATTPHDTGSYAWVWIALGLVTVIAVLSTVLRVETLYSSGVVDQATQGGFFGSNAAGGSAEQSSAMEIAAITSFSILATIFVVTQFVGMGIGYRYGFAGKESKQAYDLTKGCPDYDTYFRPIRRRMMVADHRLTTLHAMMEKRLPGAIDWSRDFLTFIEYERSRGASDLQNPNEVDAANPRFQLRKPAADPDESPDESVDEAPNNANGMSNGSGAAGDDPEMPPPGDDDDDSGDQPETRQ